MHKLDTNADVLGRKASLPDGAAMDFSKIALIVIDMQRFFIDAPGGMPNVHAADIIANINLLSRATRDAGGMVVFTQHAFRDDGRFALPDWKKGDHPVLARLARDLSVGSPDFALHDRLDVAPGDRRITKFQPSAFHPLSYENEADGLHHLLRQSGIETLIITGTVTNGCCECTARDAWQHHYRVLFVSDANAAATDAEHNASLNGMGGFVAHVVSTAQTADWLSAGSGVGSGDLEKRDPARVD